MKKKILIFGAGAIGRGYIAPLFNKIKYEIHFVDTNKKLVDLINKNKSYTAAFTNKKKYKFYTVKDVKAFHVSDNYDSKLYDIVVSCVGPNECYKIAHKIKNAKLVISCENDPETVNQLKKLSGNNNIFFGIPDVITSNTASKKLLKKDKLIVISEVGKLIVNANLKLPKPIINVDEKGIIKHWRCKLLIHNAPHAIIAYLGYLKKYEFIHQAMNDIEIKKIVRGAMNEITSGIIISKFANKKFALDYKKKELKRFENKLLFDPISRVSRNPLRKLDKNNRLPLALRVASFGNKLPKNLSIGLIAAFNYINNKDMESVHLQHLKKSLGESKLLEDLCGILQSEPLNKYCTNQITNKFFKFYG
jgi:mannitol-1-phosphate 5-dehydrogenase|tara:strand:+ start:7843 stop:8928 length:1086 start_codon:yes stop_codon:yes gene_type:complete